MLFSPYSSQVIWAMRNFYGPRSLYRPDIIYLDKVLSFKFSFIAFYLIRIQCVWTCSFIWKYEAGYRKYLTNNLCIAPLNLPPPHCDANYWHTRHIDAFEGKLLFSVETPPLEERGILTPGLIILCFQEFRASLLC